jgi:hypothetical protein
MTDDEELIARLRSKIIIHTDAAVWMLEAAGRLDVLDGEVGSIHNATYFQQGCLRSSDG